MSASAAAFVVTVTLFSVMYSVNPALPLCVSWYESGYQENACSGVAHGKFQYTKPTGDWLAEMAREDVSFPHRSVIGNPFDPYDDVQAAALFMWAVLNGYLSHWDTYPLCADIQPLLIEEGPCPEDTEQGRKTPTKPMSSGISLIYPE